MTPRQRSVGRDALGSGTMLTVAVMVVLLVIAVLVCGFAGYAVAQHQATNAADLSALAGARAQGGGASPCPAASRLAGANRAAVTSCSAIGTTSDFVITVVVRVQVPYRIPGLPKSVTAEADAGPVQ